MKKRFGYADYKPLLDQFVSLVLDTMGNQLISIVLYGSVARGEASSKSDIDLLLVLKHPSPIYYERLQPLLPLLRQLRQGAAGQRLQTAGLMPEVNVLILSHEEADQNRLLYLDMIEDARILVDRGDFFQNRLQQLQRRLRELDARKIRRDGGWYWDLKPDLGPEETVVL